MFSRDACPPEKMEGVMSHPIYRAGGVNHLHRQTYSHVALELKLEEVVGDLCSALARKHKHLVPAYSYGEVAARWRNLTALIDLTDTKAETQALTHRTLNVLLVREYLKFILLTSSQHACSRSCRLMVHMSFSLPWVIKYRSVLQAKKTVN